MDTKTMTKKKKTEQLQTKEVAKLEPAPRRHEARPCTMCETRRPLGKSYSRVYTTRGSIQYCKCGLCGHTWAQERR
jgi:hypothetical protein